MMFISEILAEDALIHWHKRKKLFVYIALLFVSNALICVSNNHPYYLARKDAIGFRSNIIISIVERVLALNSSFNNSAAQGNITNLVQSDSSLLVENSYCVVNVPYFVSLFFITMAVAIYQMRLAFAIYIAFFVVSAPVLFYLVNRVSYYDDHISGLKDQRAALLWSIFSNIRFVKMNVLENFFVRLAHDYRLQEMTAIRKIIYIICLNVTVGWLVPALAQLSYVWSALLLFKQLQAPKFVSSLQLFGIISRISSYAPWTLQGITCYRLAFRRLNAFFTHAQPELVYVQALEAHSPMAIKVRGVFSHESETAARFIAETQKANGSEVREEAASFPDFKLEVDLEVNAGETVFIIGKIGSGKSSLIRALLGDLKAEEGSVVQLKGQVAYCPQTPFLLCKSVRDNIVFYRDLAEESLARACRVAQLQGDIDTQALSLAKEMVENGINVSGGQRMRINLARCFYASRDIYLFDDPFSSLDANVGSALFEAMRQELQGKTLLIVTHNLQLLRSAQRLLYFEKGRVAFDGSFEAFRETSFAEELLTATVIPAEDDELAEKSKAVPEVHEAVTEGRDAADEVPMAGALPQYRNLWKAAKLIHRHYGASGLTLLVTGLAYLAMAMGYYSNKLITDYLDASPNGFSHPQAFLRRYSLYCLASSLAICLRFFFMSYVAYRTHRRMVERMLLRAVHADLSSFYDKSGVAKLTTRFSRDINELDGTVIYCLSEALLAAGFLLLDLAFNCRQTSPYIAVFYVGYLAYCLQLQSVYAPFYSQLNVEERESLTPLMDLYGDVLRGSRLLASFGVSTQLVGEAMLRVNANAEVMFKSIATHCWFEFRLRAVNLLFVQVLPTVLVLAFTRQHLQARQLRLYFIYLSGFIWHIISGLFTLSSLESSAKALERCQQVLDLPPERGYENLAQNAHFVEKNIDAAPGLLVPQKQPNSERFPYERINSFGFDRRLFQAGRIVFDSVTARYAPSLPQVIRGLSLVVEPGSKVGVCGKTGSGKSTLVKLLTAYLTPESGRVSVDDYDITAIELKALRSEFALVSQEITLFAGTLRENLNPALYGQSAEGRDMQAEQAVVERLISFGFKEEKLAGQGLDLRIESDGNNISPGERQLIVFFRAMASDRRIVILDEATSSIDADTERKLMEYFYTAMQGKTVISVAHRINTIIECDKIVLMQRGEIKEMGTPRELQIGRASCRERV